MDTTMEPSPAAVSQIRVGRLVPPQPISGDKEMPLQTVWLLDQREYGKSVRQHVREFGVLFGVVCLIIAGYQAYKFGRISVAGYWTAAALALSLAGYAVPLVLYPLWRAWMAFAHVLGAVMTSVILFITWVLMLLPMALVLHLVGKRVMEMGFRTAQPSYWEPKKRETTDFKLLERQF
jgi:hypothetical protein